MEQEKNSSTAPEKENPWNNEQAFRIPKGRELGIAGLLYLLACLTIPLSFLYWWFAAASWVILLAGGFYLTRRMVSGVRLTLIVSLLSLLFAVFSPTVGALVAAFSVGIMCGSFLQTSTRAFWIPVLLSLSSAGAVFALTQEWLIALTALLLLPATLALSFATTRGEYRTTSICYAVGGLLAGGGILAALWLWQTQGSLRIEVIQDLLEGWQNEWIREWIEARDLIINTMRELPTGNDAQAEAMVNLWLQALSDERITEAVTSYFRYAPALLFIVCAIPAFLAQKMLNCAYVSNGMSRVVTPESEFFTMSLPAAVIYILSAVVMLCFSQASIPVMVAGNLCLILMPGFTVAGVQAFRARTAQMPPNMRWIFLLPVIFLFCCMQLGIFLLIALYGAYGRLFSAARHKMEEKMKQNDDQDSNRGSGPF